MSATAQTGNYHLPIYEAGNLANYMVDWNGAMNTIDAALNVNHTDADKLKTDFEAIETEFQQVKTESSGAATAATQAQTDAARAITIANNATTVAGDAQVDAHAVLQAYNDSRYSIWDIHALDQFVAGTDFSGHYTISYTAIGTVVSANIAFKTPGINKLVQIHPASVSLNVYRFPQPINDNILNALLTQSWYWASVINNTAHRNFYFSFGYFAGGNAESILSTSGLFIDNDGKCYYALRGSDFTKNTVGGQSETNFQPYPDGILTPTKLSSGIVSIAPLIINTAAVTEQELSTITF